MNPEIKIVLLYIALFGISDLILLFFNIHSLSLKFVYFSTILAMSYFLYYPHQFSSIMTIN